MKEHVLATFTRRAEAEAAVERTRAAFPGVPVRFGDTDDELDALALGQRAEMDESMPAVPVGVMSGPMARGALVWGLVGLVAGALLSLPVSALTDTGSWPRWQLAAFMALAGALGVSSAMFVLGAARQAVKEGETMPEDPTAVVRADCPPEQAGELIDLLTAQGARRARFVDAPVSRRPTAESEAPRSPHDDPAAHHGAGSDSDAGFRSDVP
jgi:hypothetical protein